jgi:hypothetical protein
MFVPTRGMLVGGLPAEAVFALAVAAVAVFLMTELARTGRIGVLWLVVAVDLAAMAYMFVAMSGGTMWLTWLLVAWFVLQSLGWASGKLADTVDSGGLGGTPSAHRPGDPDRASAHTLSIRLTLLIMTLGMAYMFVALAVGGMPMPMLPAPPGMPTMPGM